MKRSQEKRNEKRKPGPILPRRYFLWGMAISGISLFAMMWTDGSIFRRIYYRIQDLFSSPQIVPPRHERKDADLSADGYKISVETALNSRCTSDHDGNPRRFHWGMFDETRKLSESQVREIVELTRVPQLSGRRVEMEVENNKVTFVIDGEALGSLRDWMMIESGMQQQAIALVCAALGAGMVFENLGKDGRKISEKNYATIKVKLDAMKPTYRGKFWSSERPDGGILTLEGSLPEPQRDGGKPLIPTMRSLRNEEKDGVEITKERTSQLLWAARGRTPHYYKSSPWGMTIPTWGGEQNISSLYLVSSGAVWKYVNWHKNQPVHRIEAVATLESEAYGELVALAPPHNSIIVQAKNEDYGRALWEIGYSLLNMMLQAKSLGLAYKAVLLEEKDKLRFKQAGIDGAVSAVFLGKEEGAASSAKGKMVVN